MKARIKAIVNYFKGTAALSKAAKIWHIKRRWFETNKSLEKRILQIMEKAKERIK